MKTKRVFIGIFGRRNTGKSSLINAIAKQDIAIVSPLAGTTTDPVKKSIEIFGIGPVVFVDTAGMDDVGDLGKKRIRKTQEALKTIDVAIVLSADNLWGEMEKEIIQQLLSLQIPYLILHNKSDLTPLSASLKEKLNTYHVPVMEVSATTKAGIDELIDKLVEITPPTAYTAKTLIGDIISKGNIVLLVMPQDDEAPEGRLILPQVQLIRDILDNNAIAVGLQPDELKKYLEKQTPDLVITDSQAFDKVSRIVPQHIPLTSFSIVLARAKGHFEHYLAGSHHLNKLQNGDRVLMLESCTHPVSCEDIGRHKLPNLIRKYTGKQIAFDFISGLSPVSNPCQYVMAIQCGGCMVTDKQLHNRIKQLIDCNIPVSNYGMAIAFLTGIFDRVTKVFSK
ncbi:MAG: [FeFe] hydrogenase H-cluster maturation GTPase HydF [Bacteroidales bacterium]|jgi:[FeFe] hydrogenase H-cluster maturation GTPase HydF|nr:[FeFe] hydrogenase H-cluster maturation GTPase HydF [Bacteroidales bacterium]